jgi:hypothetical protein
LRRTYRGGKIVKANNVLAVTAILILVGCGNAATETTEGAQQGPAQPAGQDPLAPLSKVGVKRIIDRPAVQNDLRQLALFYMAQVADLGRVRTVDAFTGYIKRDAPQLVKALQDNVYVVVPNIRPAAGIVLAYEKTPDAAGQHIVAMGDGMITQMSTRQLQAALAGRGN